VYVIFYLKEDISSCNIMDFLSACTAYHADKQYTVQINSSGEVYSSLQTGTNKIAVNSCIQRVGLMCCDVDTKCKEYDINSVMEHKDKAMLLVADPGMVISRFLSCMEYEFKKLNSSMWDTENKPA